MAFEISHGGRSIGTLTLSASNIIAHGPDGQVIGQFGDFAAAVARLMRAAS